MMAKRGKEGFLAGKHFKVISGLLALFLISLAFDFQISSFVTSLSYSWIYFGFLALGLYASYMIVGIPSIIVFLKDRKKTLYMWAAMASAWLLDAALKIGVHRIRPFDAGIIAPDFLVKASYKAWDFSFPSSHAALSFAAIPFLPKKWVIPWVVLAALISFSRVYFGLHYLSDVIAGAAIGLMIGFFVKKKFVK